MDLAEIGPCDVSEVLVGESTEFDVFLSGDTTTTYSGVRVEDVSSCTAGIQTR